MTSETISTVDLIKAAVGEARELVQLELKIAREEVKEEVQRLKKAAIVAGIATGGVILALASLLVALIFALGATLEAALFVALGFAVVGGAFAVAAYVFVPKTLLPRTRSHLMHDVEELKEHTVDELEGHAR